MEWKNQSSVPGLRRAVASTVGHGEPASATQAGSAFRVRCCRSFARTLCSLAGIWLIFGAALPARASLQFDVFLGYGGQPTGTDGVVREASWFPVACEVLNDGPPFNAVFELSSSQMGGGQSRRIVVELPTNTRKRFVIPAFAASGTYSSWDARLLDERGKVRAEKLGLRPKGLNWESVLLGAVPRTFAGLPRLPELRGHNARSPMQPLVARLQVEQLPDSPVPLEGLDAIYLNSEKALELKVNQAEALLAWVHEGGHLIVGVEQPSDVNATPWLRSVLPCELNNLVTLKSDRTIQDWLRRDWDEPGGTKSNSKAAAKLKPAQIPGYRPLSAGANPFATMQADTEFEKVEFSAATGVVRDGQVQCSLGQTPLVITGRRGRGEVTVLTFSPEREPFRSWKNRDWLWAKLARVPSLWFGQDNLNFYGGHSVDSVVGAMIDSRQVRKLPVKWLMLLLLVYLLVIGPVDQYWLKRLNKQMLTWLTFPAYVALFSLLIYYIGYKLRAGETEWNELHLVDVLPRGEAAVWRGRTYASVYSPVNARYQLAGEQADATLRGEFMGGVYGAGQEGSRAEVEQRGKGFNAEIYVPVWTSQLFVSDWMQPDDMPFTATVVTQGSDLQVTVHNRLSRELKEVRLIARDKLYELGNLPANKTTTMTLGAGRGRFLRDFVQQYAGQFQNAAGQRQRAFGENAARWLELNPANLTAVTFISQSPYLGPAQRGFVYPDGVELTPSVERGDAVLLAWDAGNAPAGNSMRRFKSVRSQKNTMLRLAVPIGQPNSKG